MSTDKYQQLLHVYDLPQLYTKPGYEDLSKTLQLLCRTGCNFYGNFAAGESSTRVDEAGVPRYLTSIISSPLQWLNDEQRELILELASQRLAERSGRSAAPSMTRSFQINDDLTIHLYEPSLTEDSLGLKTWTSSLLLARRLEDMKRFLPHHTSTVLELGAGTGLVGLAAARIWKGRISQILLTDLPHIVPNLQRNIDAMRLAEQQSEPICDCVKSRVLDWSKMDKPDIDHHIIIAADPIYDAEHPRMLVETVERHIAKSDDSRFILEMPIREGYMKERKDLRHRLEKIMVVVEEGQEIGYDDWESKRGDPLEVECWWSVWKLKEFGNVYQ